MVAKNCTGKDAETANLLLMQVSKLINTEWTVLSCWEGTIYPTQQVEWRCTWLIEGLNFL